MERKQTANDIHQIDPTDLNALAAAAFTPAKRAMKKPRKNKSKQPQPAVGYRGPLSAEERCALIAKLIPTLKKMTRRLAKRDNDLAEELVAHVLLQCERGKYNPRKGKGKKKRKGNFAAWVRIVMERKFITLVKSRGRAIGGDDPHPEREDTRTPASESEDRTSPFNAADLKSILKWRPIKRVLLLSRSLLWRKLPAKLWSDSLKAAGLPDPFPCSDFEDMSLPEQNSYLADAFGLKLNTIHVSMDRWHKHLLALQFVRDLAAREGIRIEKDETE